MGVDFVVKLGFSVDGPLSALSRVRSIASDAIGCVILVAD